MHRRTVLPHSLSVATALVALASAHAYGAADTYRLDPVHSQIWFTTDHQGFSKPQGRLHVRDGWFRFDPKDWSSAEVDVVIDMASIDLGDARWNDTVKSGQFVDATRWPTARYVGRTVEAKDATHAIVRGELEFHGEKHPLDLAVTLNRTGNDPYAFKHKAGFGATATLSRAVFGITRYTDVVADDVAIHIQVEGIRDRDAARPATGARDDAEK